jgi:hypothetical protein
MTYFFMAAGGGVPGKGAGIVRVTMTEDGDTIEACPPFIDMFPPVGAATIGIAAGKGMNGINAPFRTAKLKRTGGAGKETSIGKKKITGV